MINFTEQINNCISGKMSPEEMFKLENSLKENEGLREQYQILLSSREYIKAKSVLEEIENDPDLPQVMDQVIDHYEGKYAFEKRTVYLNRVWDLLISVVALFGALILMRILMLVR